MPDEILKNMEEDIVNRFTIKLQEVIKDYDIDIPINEIIEVTKDSYDKLYG